VSRAVILGSLRRVRQGRLRIRLPDGSTRCFGGAEPGPGATITVHDPRLTAPWTALLPMAAMEDVLYEYACHEGNYSLANMLAGARADERAAAEGAR